MQGCGEEESVRPGGVLLRAKEWEEGGGARRGGRGSTCRAKEADWREACGDAVLLGEALHVVCPVADGGAVGVVHLDASLKENGCVREAVGVKSWQVFVDEVA